jgi:hypothetical protein
MRTGREETVAEEIARMRPEPGDILLFHQPERFRSRLICWFTRSPFYHVGIYAGEGKVIEARIPEVMCRDLYRQKDGFRFIVLRAPHRDAGKAALGWAESKIGIRYDVRSLTLLVLSRLTGLRLCRCSQDTEQEQFICGNFVARAFAVAGVTLFPDRNEAEIVPADFARFAPSFQGKPLAFSPAAEELTA